MKTLKEQKWMLIVYAAFFIVIGLVEFILGIINPGLAIRVVSYIIASGLLVVGLLHIIASLVADTKAFFKGALILGSIAITLGILLFINPYILSAYLVLFVAIFALAIGAVLIVKAVLAIIYKYKAGWIVLYFLMAAISITFGILALVYQGQFTQIIYCATGVFLFALGIFVLVFTIKALTKKGDKVVEQQ